MPSLIDPKMASGPIAKSKDADTNPSTNVLSSCAPNFFRRVSPMESNLDSKFSADPISPPISNAPNIASSVHPFGRALIYREPHIGAKALTAPSIVINPRTSVIKVRVRRSMREPIKTPSPAPPIMVAIFTTVPKPTNIDRRIDDDFSRNGYKLQQCICQLA